MFNSELVQDIMFRNQRLGKLLGTEETSNCCSAGVYNPSCEGNEGVCKDCGEHCSIVRTIDIDYIPTETTLEPTFKLFFARINGKLAYMKMGRYEYRIRKMIGSR